MTDFDWEAFAARVTFRPGPRFTLSVRTRMTQTTLMLALETVDVLSGKPTVIRHEYPAPHAHCDEHAYRIVRDMAIKALTHEVDESLLVDGKQQRDPHSGKG